VRAESLAGFNADKLLQVRIGQCEIPTPFNIVQTIESQGPSIPADKFAQLLETIRRKIGAI
jgi:hypothetical protein